jgi:hypothetical protein
LKYLNSVCSLISVDSSNLSGENNYMGGEGDTCYGYKPTELPYKVDPHLDYMDISPGNYLQ